jgi:hypothetical protein
MHGTRHQQFRVPLDSNHYTVPSRYAGLRLTLKAHADRVCIYDGDQLIARHARSMDRHKDIEDPDHERQLLALVGDNYQVRSH